MIRFPSLARTLGTCAAFALCAHAASAKVVWRGDFSTGDLSQWSGTETVGQQRLKVVPDPLDGSRQVLSATVHQGDDPIHASGNRNELTFQDDDLNQKGGVERFYRWQSMWPTDYTSENTWQLFTQWHHYTGGGSPPVEFYVWGDEIRLTVLTEADKAMWSVPLERGRWHDFVFHVNWSADAKVGYVELWYDGKIVIPKHYCPTLFPGQGVYLKQGLYRKETIKVPQTVFHTGMTVGTSLDDVWPQEQQKAETVGTTGGTTAKDSGQASATSSIGQDKTEHVQVLSNGGCAQAGAGEAGLALGVAALLLVSRRKRVAQPQA